MGLSERKEQERKIKENDILDAVERLFLSKGVENTTMDDIAKEAEFSKRTLYIYFKNKAQLMLGLVAREIEGLSAILEKIMEQYKEENGLVKLRQMGEKFIEYFAEAPEYFPAIQERAHFKKEDYTDDNAAALRCKEASQRCIQVLIDIIKEGTQDGSMKRDIDPVETAIILWSGANGALDFINKESDTLKYFFDREPADIINKIFELLYDSVTKS